MAKNEWDVVSQTPLQAAAQDEWSVVSQTPLQAPPQKPPQDEWSVVSQTPQDTTKNPFIGLVGRTASLAGATVGAVAEIGERIGDKLELTLPLSNLSEEEIRNKKQLQPLFDWAKSLKDYDESLGYQPSTQLKELASNPLNAIPFIAERVITSAPDMVAAARVFPAYVMARTKEILDERVKNDNKTLDDATVADVTAAATAAVAAATRWLAENDPAPCSNPAPAVPTARSPTAGPSGHPAVREAAPAVASPAP